MNQIEAVENGAIQERNELLRDIPYEVVRKAWFTLSHLLLDDGAHVADMGCGDGQMSYAMAVLNPKIKITAIDKSKRLINKARETYKIHNLEFMAAEVSSEMFEAGTLDAIINSYILHEVYSGSRYNERIVADTLRRHFRMLKVGGTMFIRDYARPPPEEFVLMEMPDTPSTGNDLKSLSETDLLIWYSEHARPRQDPGCGGFFLEELPPRFPHTRLFRLPYKWAYEFIMRKDARSQWETELPMEYTFFTMREFRKELRALGARVTYSTPYWDEDIIEKNFDGRFRLYDDNGNPLGNPPTCFLAVAQKMSERKSLYIEERRPSPAAEGNVKIFAMRNEKTGEIVDVATRGIEVAEILPFTVDEDNNLKIFLHDGVARGVANAVPRAGINLDGKRWSGHMIEPIALDMELIEEAGAFDAGNTVRFARDRLGLKPAAGAVLERGPHYYPAPDFIDERVHTYYLKVESPGREIAPRNFIGYAARFQARGKIRELHAQHVLNAIAVGMIPNARLELQILSLYQHLGLQAENWTSKDIDIQINQIHSRIEAKELLKMLEEEQTPFREVKGTKGDLRTIHSIFVEEGQSHGSTAGLSSQDVDFVIADGKTINIAIVLPLARSIKGDLHAGFQIKNLPVPQRYEGSSASVSAPSFELPKEITNMKMAKKFIADKFGVPPEAVFRLGESYYSHVGMTPQKIYPFAVAAPPAMLKDPTTKFLPFHQFMLLWRSLGREPHFMLTLARAYRMLPSHMQLDFKKDVKHILEQRFAAAQPDWSIPPTYKATPVDQKSDIEIKKEAAEQAHQLRQEEVSLVETFEQEIDETIEALKESGKYEPKPEKW